MLFCLGLSGRITQISNILCASASLREKSTDEFRFNVQPPSYNSISDIIGFIPEYTHRFLGLSDARPFAGISGVKSVTITASRGVNTYTFNLRNNEMARMAGLEPATAALTVRCSTIELHPNWWRESDSNRRSSGYGPAAGTTPVNPALSQEVIVKPCLVLQLPRKSRHQHKRIPRKSVTPFSRLFAPWRGHDGG